MGQANACRLQFDAVQALTSAVNDDRQTLTQTALMKVGDTLEFWDQNASGCLETLVGTRTITGICPDEAITLDSAIDLTTVTGTAVVRNRSIDDVQAALERVYECYGEMSDYKMPFAEAISAYEGATPIGGQSRHQVADASCFQAGDSYAILSDEGLAGTGTIVSVDQATSKIVIDSDIDTSALTSPKIVNTSLTLEETILRLKSQIDTINTANEEELSDGDCDNTAFESSVTFVSGSTSLYLDGIRKRRGTAGTRATLANGAGNAALTFTSMVMGIDGNDIDIELVDPSAPSVALSVAVTGTYDGQDRKVAVTLATDGGSLITSTAKDVADAILADADAKRLVQAVYGGDGLGLQAALAATPLAGGLNDGTGDYAELEQQDNNSITGTGYKWVSYHIRPDAINRMNKPPRETEENDLIYSTAV